MARTKAELVQSAMKKLGVLATGQAPSAEDAAAVGEDVATMLATLASRRVFYVANADSIPDEAFDPLAKILTFQAGPAFSFGTLGTEAAAALAVQGERELRMITYVRDEIDAPIRAIYF